MAPDGTKACSKIKPRYHNKHVSFNEYIYRKLRPWHHLTPNAFLIHKPDLRETANSNIRCDLSTVRWVRTSAIFWRLWTTRCPVSYGCHLSSISFNCSGSPYFGTGRDKFHFVIKNLTEWISRDTTLFKFDKYGTFMSTTSNMIKGYELWVNEKKYHDAMN